MRCHFINDIRKNNCLSTFPRLRVIGIGMKGKVLYVWMSDPSNFLLLASGTFFFTIFGLPPQYLDSNLVFKPISFPFDSHKLKNILTLYVGLWLLRARFKSSISLLSVTVWNRSRWISYRIYNTGLLWIFNLSSSLSFSIYIHRKHIIQDNYLF